MCSRLASNALVGEKGRTGFKHCVVGALAALALSCFGPAYGESSDKPLSAHKVLAKVQVETLLEGLQHPWALAFLPNDEGVLITERPGRLRLWRAGELSPALEGVPAVYARAQGGLLDVALSPSFPDNRLVYLAYAEQDNDTGRAGTAVGVGRLSDDGRALEDFKVIFRQQPKLSSGVHFGARLVFDPAGYFFIALGENNQRSTAQDLDKHQGKLLRLMPDGSVPQDNPFVGKPQALPEIWSYGHRNPQGAALNPWTGRVWVHEHGPRGGDEINIPQAGLNYGWPIATHGSNYSGFAIPEAVGAEVKGMEPPHYVWKESPAISGMAFYSAGRFPQWRNSVFIGALKDRELIRLQLEGDQIVAEERLLGELGERVRDVRQGPDGYIYVLTDSSNGALLRISP
ncbi:PQQ-dependent sugar dehydrogenase [Achromobacter sp. F4_2707]|uniref:PQQ-dependent sugar dehydrogenase n=1 Tax=Achromobacter sp. F4_2707 TaxID=3114286 RepID=UPI0039C75C1C